MPEKKFSMIDPYKRNLLKTSTKSWQGKCKIMGKKLVQMIKDNFEILLNTCCNITLTVIIVLRHQKLPAVLWNKSSRSMKSWASRCVNVHLLPACFVICENVISIYQTLTCKIVLGGNSYDR